MEDRYLDVIREKLADSLAMEYPDLVPRDTKLMGLEGKVRAVLGMRRSGKTYYLFQCLAERLERGVERECLVYFNFEDERLTGMTAGDLSQIVEEYYRVHPEFRRNREVVWCFDEIQVIPGWEKFVRRLLDSEKTEIILSGSSAQLLSREVATSMRGRSMETIIFPYSFREFLRARGAEPRRGKRLFSGTERSHLLANWDAYLEFGGFPEALKSSTARERIELLQGYVDVVLLRDVGERHNVGNLQALRAFVRHLLRNPARLLSVNRVYGDFRSRGVAVAKGSLIDYLSYLEDAFLVFTIPMATSSERKRQGNPRKLYLVDHALAAAYASRPGEDRGWLLENLVALQLLRLCRHLGYVRTESGREVDFLATQYDGEQTLIQVAANITQRETFEREVRALVDAASRYKNAKSLIITETDPPRGAAIPEGIRIVKAWQWLLDS